MIVDKFEDNSSLFGISIFLMNNSLAFDVFIKLNRSNFIEKKIFYSRISRVSLHIHYKNIEESILRFEEKVDNDGFYHLLESISLRKFFKKGNMVMFNPIPTHLELLSRERRIEIFNNLSILNNEDYRNPESIDYTKLFTVYLKNTLRIKDDEIVRFESILNKNTAENSTL